VSPRAKRLAFYHRRNPVAKPLGGFQYPRFAIAHIFFIVLSLVTLSHANASNRVPNLLEFAFAEMNPPATQVTFQTIAKGYRSGLHAAMEVVARNQNEWNLLWRKHSSNEGASTTLPTIDFDKEIVVGLFLGDKPTGGYDVEIIRAEQSNRDLVISFREKAPRAGAMVTQSLTQPFHLVRVMGDSNSKVTFRRES